MKIKEQNRSSSRKYKFEVGDMISCPKRGYGIVMDDGTGPRPGFIHYVIIHAINGVIAKVYQHTADWARIKILSRGKK